VNARNINFELPPNIRVRHETTPRDFDELSRLHRLLYGAEYGWDRSFEEYVSSALTKFANSQSTRERIWLVDCESKLAGSIAIVEASRELAQLRWLLLAPALRGRGIGKWLIGEAIRFSRACGYASLFLWTEQRLEQAARLYQAFGFQLVETKTHSLWGTIVSEQRYELKL
jgi:GNAT superfamily N-acetyltransferase